MLRQTLARLGVAAALASVLAAPPSLAIDVDFLPVFGSVESRSDDLRQFTKWIRVLERLAGESVADREPCVPGTAGAECPMAEWYALLDQVSPKPPLEQIESVNAFINRKNYIEDVANYGVKDYWATPREFLRRSGDCEDYAIAKYVSLRLLGFSAAQLRIVVLDDLTLKTAHAVLLAVVDGKLRLLDNQIKDVVDADTVQHYRPLFSLNERSWWLHKRPEPLIAIDNAATSPAASGPDRAGN